MGTRKQRHKEGPASSEGGSGGASSQPRGSPARWLAGLLARLPARCWPAAADHSVFQHAQTRTHNALTQPLATSRRCCTLVTLAQPACLASTATTATTTTTTATRVKQQDLNYAKTNSVNRRALKLWTNRLILASSRLARPEAKAFAHIPRPETSLAAQTGASSRTSNIGFEGREIMPPPRDRETPGGRKRNKQNTKTNCCATRTQISNINSKHTRSI